MNLKVRKVKRGLWVWEVREKAGKPVRACGYCRTKREALNDGNCWISEHGWGNTQTGFIAPPPFPYKQ